jgi:hypothetical protein
MVVTIIAKAMHKYQSKPDTGEQWELAGDGIIHSLIPSFCHPQLVNYKPLVQYSRYVRIDLGKHWLMIPYCPGLNTTTTAKPKWKHDLAYNPSSLITTTIRAYTRT